MALILIKSLSKQCKCCHFRTDTRHRLSTPHGTCTSIVADSHTVKIIIIIIITQLVTLRKSVEQNDKSQGRTIFFELSDWRSNLISATIIGLLLYLHENVVSDLDGFAISIGVCASQPICTHPCAITRYACFLLYVYTV